MQYNYVRNCVRHAWPDHDQWRKKEMFYYGNPPFPTASDTFSVFEQWAKTEPRFIV